MIRESERLPIVQLYKYDDWPELRQGVREMEFRLTYQGKLPAASSGDTRAFDKHRIRKALHPQLRELWNTDNYLRKWWIGREKVLSNTPLEDNYTTWADNLADNYKRCDHRFLPLIGAEAGDDACALDILFLRRDHPGGLVESGGDIDNRMKVLLDALQIPKNCSKIDLPGTDEDPFYCLLTDDSLITELKITTDRLLTPLAEDERIHDVHLVIHVRTISYAVHLSM